MLSTYLYTAQNPGIITNGLVYYLEADNRNSYIGFGNVWNPLNNVNPPNPCNAFGSLVWTITTKGNGSVYFGGLSSQIITSSACPFGSFSSTSQITLQMWINVAAWPTSAESYFVVPLSQVTTYGLAEFGINIGLYGSPLYIQQFSVFTGNAGISANSTPADINENLNQWYFVCGTFANSIMTVYVNGKSAASGAYGSLGSTNTLPICIGQQPYGGTAYYEFSGSIGHISIYNRYLSPAEITSNFAATRGHYGV